MVVLLGVLRLHNLLTTRLRRAGLAIRSVKLQLEPNGERPTAHGTSDATTNPTTSIVNVLEHDWC